MARGKKGVKTRVWREELHPNEYVIKLHSRLFDLQINLKRNQIYEFSRDKDNFSFLYLASYVECQRILSCVPYPTTLVVQTRVKDYFYPLFHYRLLLRDKEQPFFKEYAFIWFYGKVKTCRSSILSQLFGSTGR